MKRKLRFEKAWSSGRTTNTVLRGHIHSVLCLTLVEKTLFTGHTHAVECLQPFNELLVTGSQDRSIRIWRTGHHFSVDCEKIDSPIEVNAVGILCEGNPAIVAGGTDEVVRVWDMDLRREIRQLTGHSNWVYCLQVTNTLVVTGSFDATIRLWDFKASVPAIGRLTGHDDFVYCIAFEPPYIFSGGADRTIRIWDMRMMGQVKKVLAHKHGVNWLHYRRDLGCRVASVAGNADHDIILWNFDEQAGVLRDSAILSGHTGGINAVYFDHKRIITGSSDRTIRVWKLDNREPS